MRPAAATVVHKREASACVALEEIVRLVKEGKFYPRWDEGVTPCECPSPTE